jgi:hypothetical protein
LKALGPSLENDFGGTNIGDGVRNEFDVAVFDSADEEEWPEHDVVF